MDIVTVVWGKELIAPVQYNNFEVGPFTMTTEVLPHETPEEAWARAYGFLDRQARASYAEKLKTFREHYVGSQQATTRR